MSLVNNNNNMEDNDQQNKTFKACREHTTVTFLHLIEGQTFEWLGLSYNDWSLEYIQYPLLKLKIQALIRISNILSIMGFFNHLLTLQRFALSSLSLYLAKYKEFTTKSKHRLGFNDENDKYNKCFKWSNEMF